MVLKSIDFHRLPKRYCASMRLPDLLAETTDPHRTLRGKQIRVMNEVVASLSFAAGGGCEKIQRSIKLQEK